MLLFRINTRNIVGWLVEGVECKSNCAFFQNMPSYQILKYALTNHFIFRKYKHSKELTNMLLKLLDGLILSVCL